MKKFKVGASLLFLIVILIAFKNFLLLLNYFVALILHELAHLFVANLKGYKLKQVRLDIFGLSISLEDKILDKDSFAINIAGPLFNLILCLICMSLYWAVPSSYAYLNNFCFANFCLAVFNLLPIYPLDGGKIFHSFFKSEKTYRKTDLTIRIILSVLFGLLFVVSCFKTVNLFYLIMVFFFVTSMPKNTPTFSIFKTAKEKNFSKIVLIKVNEKCTILQLLKQIKRNQYTIFYCNSTKKHYLDEDNLINLSLSNPLTSSLKEILIWYAELT